MLAFGVLLFVWSLNFETRIALIRDNLCDMTMDVAFLAISNEVMNRRSDLLILILLVLDSRLEILYSLGSSRRLVPRQSTVAALRLNQG
jgi:hypothetical protein